MKFVEQSNVDVAALANIYQDLANHGVNSDSFLTIFHTIVLLLIS